MSAEEEIRDIVDVAKSPKTFSIIDVLAERAYPETKISVSLDEASAYEAAVLKDELDSLVKKIGSKNASAEQNERIQSMSNEIEKYVSEMQKSTYTFYVKGISEGKREELSLQARKKYPVEYEKPSDLSMFLPNQGDRTEKPSPERDNLFTDLLWLEHIQKIEDPNGSIQENLTYSDVRALRSNLPLSALAKINSEIEKLRAATAVFMMETGEDFLAKP